ncbi:hypothetical protein Q8W43_18750 [Klebsiella pneumoniae]|nr:hypothetical protein Q8W43_18750 [Klebsiella pneumoniae]
MEKGKRKITATRQTKECKKKQSEDESGNRSSREVALYDAPRFSNRETSNAHAKLMFSWLQEGQNKQELEDERKGERESYLRARGDEEDGNEATQSSGCGPGASAADDLPADLDKKVIGHKKENTNVPYG